MKKSIWGVVPKDYRSIKNGKKYVLVMGKGGTTLVPLNSKEAKKSWGKFLKK
jgi:hypothetical protein